MNDDPTILKLMHIWPQLPQLSGADWPRIYWQLDKLVQRYRMCEIDEDRAYCTIQIRKIVVDLPTTRAAWNAAPVRVTTRGFGLRDGRDLGASTEFKLDEPFDIDSVLVCGEKISLSDLLGRSMRVRRWTDVLAPNRVQVGARFPVIVGLTRKPTDAASKSLLAHPDQKVRVVVKSSSLDVLGEPVKEVVDHADKDSEPAVFYFQALETGSHDLLIDFWLEGELVASQTAMIAAVAEATTDALVLWDFSILGLARMDESVILSV